MTVILTQDEKRKLHRQFSREHQRIAEERDRIWQEWEDLRRQNPLAKIPVPELPEYPKYPRECLDLTCGALTRSGHPCRQKALYDNGRCKFHGGMSTGPRTRAGKRRSAANGFKKKSTKSTEG